MIAILIYGAVIIVAIILYKTGTDTGILTKDKFTIYITGIMSLGILVAYRQIQSNNDLSRRQLSMTESIRIVNDIRQKRFKLDEFTGLDYSQEMQKKHVISYQEVHKWICIMDDNGSCKGESGEYELTEDGKQIKAYIRATINDFEYIAVGILNGAFDERIIKDGMRGMVKSTYNSFSGYIDHVRDTEKVPAFAENLEWLANRWSDNKKSKSLRA